MKTQVLIPAQNESARIERLLRKLPAANFDVTVVVNGSTDDTFDVADRYANTYEIEESGKLPAIQYALKQLGKTALDTLLLIDADTVPLRAESWRKHMTQALRSEYDIPTVVSGPIVYTPNETGVVNPVFRSMFRYATTIHSKQPSLRLPQTGTQFGPNMGIHLGRPQTLDAVLELPHIWPKEDVALAMTVVESHESAVFDQILHPGATALTPRPKPMQPIMDWILNPQETARAEQAAYETSRPASGTVSFDEWNDRR